MTETSDPEFDWSLTTWKGSRRQQHREFYALPFARKLQVIEDLAEVARMFRRKVAAAGTEGAGRIPQRRRSGRERRERSASLQWRRERGVKPAAQGMAPNGRARTGLDTCQDGYMGSHMKTTIELPETLLLRAKRVALDRRTTLKKLIERGLERELAEPSGIQKSAFEQLAALDASIWEGVRADTYVEEQRKNWE